MPHIPRPPWLAAVLLALSLAFGAALPDYAFALDHAPTSFVCVDTSKPVVVESRAPMAIVLARNRTIEDEHVDNGYLLRSSATERSSDSGMSNPLKRRLS